MRTAAGMRHATLAEILAEFAGPDRGTVIAEKPGAVLDSNRLHSRDRQRLVKCLRDIDRAHRRAQLPRDDVARGIAEHG